MISILQYASKQIEITTYITRRPKRASQGGQTSAGIDMQYDILLTTARRKGKQEQRLTVLSALNKLIRKRRYFRGDTLIVG